VPARRHRRSGIRNRLVARLGGQRNSPVRSKAVIAQASNDPSQQPVGMVCSLPVQGEANAASLNLDGTETFDITGLENVEVDLVKT